MDITVIANHCTGGYWYKLQNIQYTNPFMWNYIDIESMLNLIINFDRINFSHINLISNPFDIPILLVDNKVTIRYPHILFDESQNTPQIKDINVYTNRPWKYAVEKYLTRVKRMCAQPRRPIFILSEDDKLANYAISFNELVDGGNKLIASNLQHKVLLFSHTDNIGNYIHHPLIQCIYAKPYSAFELAQYILENQII